MYLADIFEWSVLNRVFTELNMRVGLCMLGGIIHRIIWRGGSSTLIELNTSQQLCYIKRCLNMGWINSALKRYVNVIQWMWEQWK